MKIPRFFIIFLFIIFFGCDNNDDGITTINFQFTHSWGNQPISESDLENTLYTNVSGNELNITRLRYLISDIQLTNQDGTLNLGNHQLIDLSNEESLRFTANGNIVFAENNTLSFRFGLSNEDNIDGIYTDLNTANFNVPNMLGGGYHYMQLDGNFTDDSNATQPYNFHAIRAIDNTDSNNIITTDTSFVVTFSNVNISRDNITITVNMDISQWFTNPNTWDLNLASTGLMGDYDAQIVMSQNGNNVFSFTSAE